MKNTKRTMRNTGISLLFALFSFGLSGSAKAQVEPVVAVKGLYTAAKWTHDHWKTIKWVFTGMKHRRWACFYQDGFITYNDFRSYRTGLDAYQYFVQGKGDCDAFYAVGTQHKKICYSTPLHAKKYAAQHGPVTDIQYKDDNGKYRSIYEH